jgi:hypothetical protein
MHGSTNVKHFPFFYHPTERRVPGRPRNRQKYSRNRSKRLNREKKNKKNAEI